MFTLEELKQNKAFEGVSDENLNSILTLVNNSEQAAISKRVGELHGQYDADILAVTGMQKNAGEKSYDFVKRVLGDYKTKLKASEDKVADLTKKVADGSQDEQLKKDLADAKSLAEQVKGQLTAKQKELDALKETHAAELLGMQFDAAFNTAAAGLKYKAGITENVQKALLQAAKTEILARGKAEVQTDGTLVLRGADGEILRNKNNNYNPYTVSELLNESSIKDVLDTGNKGGGGTGAAGGGGGMGNLLDLSNVQTQIEADRAIEQHLLAKGLTRDSAEFAEESMKLRTDNNISSLPIR